jgi:tetratricopeptide (TPR) repeat protein
MITPTPLDILLGIKYTPTPLYINTPHPKSESYRSGIRALTTGKWDDAIEYMEQVLRENKDAVDALYYIGEAYRYKAFYPQAIDAYQQALKINDKFAPAFLEEREFVLHRIIILKLREISNRRYYLTQKWVRHILRRPIITY